MGRFNHPVNEIDRLTNGDPPKPVLIGVFGNGSSASTAQFEQALSLERRSEFAFENQRWFYLVCFNTTMTTITAEQ